jgi:hypothetical protein
MENMALLDALSHVVLLQSQLPSECLNRWELSLEVWLAILSASKIVPPIKP